MPVFTAFKRAFILQIVDPVVDNPTRNGDQIATLLGRNFLGVTFGEPVGVDLVEQAEQVGTSRDIVRLGIALFPVIVRAAVSASASSGTVPASGPG